ncbi:unnamed protein product [Plutella xylostella]|uniref:(diamondback moth) hypothetical protein n=1 Tax=Plutella xylostella TaxID=51655 RepID=A0A8S4G3D0_PLUXY|nr:unnamed protein product [Plutella xylostella]
MDLPIITLRADSFKEKKWRNWIIMNNNMKVLHEAMTRCVSVLSSTSSQETLASSVCAHCSRCFAVAAQFPSCLQVMSELPLLCGNLIPLLTRPNLGDTACAGAEAVAALAVDPACRAALVQAGAVHALIPLVLRYDYTLTESGVDTTQANTNKQVSEPRRGGGSPSGREAVAALAVGPLCRAALVQAGAVHALIPLVLRYDYTLTESGVDTTQANTNKQNRTNAAVKLYAFDSLGATEGGGSPSGREAVAALAVGPLCRAALVQAGAVHALIPLVLRYDYTLTESGVDTTQANTNKQEVANTLARLSVQALAALYGPHDTRGAEDVRVCSTLHTLLTPYLCRRLHTSAPHEVTQQALAALYGPHDTRGAEDVRVCSTLHTLLTPYLCRRLHTSAPHEVTQQALAALYGPHDTRGAEDVRVCSTLHTLLTPYLCRRLHTSAPHEVTQQALAALYGPHDTRGAEDVRVCSTLHTLLTPYLCRRLHTSAPHEVTQQALAALYGPHDTPGEGRTLPDKWLLKTLTSNWRTPYLVWDNSVRAELSAALETAGLTGDVTGLAYSAHEGLLPVGHVYLRIYNQRPDEPIENPQQFVLDLLQFISEQTAADLSAERVEHITMALTALSNCIIKNPGVEIQCIGQFGLLFGLLSARAHSGVQQAALAAVLAAAGNRAVLEDIAATHVLGNDPSDYSVRKCRRLLDSGHLLALVGTRPPPEGALPALSALLANTSLVKEALAKGAVIYLLDIFCNSKVPETREAAVEILACMMSDKLHGPKVRLTISRYIPAVFAEAMCAGAPQSVIHMMDSRHEHPELVWSDEARATVAATVAACRDRVWDDSSPSYLMDSRHEHPELVWSDEARATVAATVAASRDSPN